jgi:hypothetical protein
MMCRGVDRVLTIKLGWNLPVCAPPWVHCGLSWMKSPTVFLIVFLSCDSPAIGQRLGLTLRVCGYGGLSAGAPVILQGPEVFSWGLTGWKSPLEMRQDILSNLCKCSDLWVHSRPRVPGQSAGLHGICLTQREDGPSTLGAEGWERPTLCGRSCGCLLWMDTETSLTHDREWEWAGTEPMGPPAWAETAAQLMTVLSLSRPLHFPNYGLVNLYKGWLLNSGAVFSPKF